MQNPQGRLAEAYTCPATGSCTTKKTDLGFSYSARGRSRYRLCSSDYDTFKNRK